jgi:hypothetical protein
MYVLGFTTVSTEHLLHFSINFDHLIRMLIFKYRSPYSKSSIEVTHLDTYENEEEQCHLSTHIKPLLLSSLLASTCLKMVFVRT